MAATLVLAVAATVGTQATFTLAADTLVWMDGPKENRDSTTFARVGVEIKGSDALYSDILTMGGPNRSGVLPAGEYRVTRLAGTCGFQRAA